MISNCAVVILGEAMYVLAMHPIGSRMALIVNGHQYCVSTADYWQVMGAAGSATAESELIRFKQA